MLFEILGEAAHDPEVIQSAERIRKRYREAADTFFERLFIEGVKQNISIEDIERVVSLEKLPDGRSPTFIREVIIELLICLRPK